MIQLCDNPSCTGRPHCRAEDVPRLRRLLEDISLLSLSGSFRSAAKRFAELRQGLERDMGQLSFADESELIHLANAWLHELLAGLGDALCCNDAPRAQGAIAELWQMLRVHTPCETRGDVSAS